MEAETINQAVEAFLTALTAKEQAEQAHDEARELLIATFASEGVSEAEFAELNVKVSPAERRSFSVEKLREQLSPALFRKVTKPAIDTKAWDSAVDKGEITKKVIKSCVEITNSVRVLVKPAKGSVKPASRAEAV